MDDVVKSTANQKRATLARNSLILRGAANGTRTRDPQLGKLMLYQLSYCRKSDFKRNLLKTAAKIRNSFERKQDFIGLFSTFACVQDKHLTQ